MMIGTREVIHETRLPLSGNWQPELCASLVGNGQEKAVSGPHRRQEARIEAHQSCFYELCESIDEEAVVIQHGEAYSLNRSAHGILVLMGQAPRIQQLLELHMPESWWRRSINLFEVQWAKPVHVESQGDLFLVGCRLTFGPTHYWAL